MENACSKMQQNKSTAAGGEAGAPEKDYKTNDNLSIFTKSQASSPFEAMNSSHLSMCQKDVRPSVQKRWRTMAFSRVSTGYSVIPSSCEMKYDPAFKPLQGNTIFF